MAPTRSSSSSDSSFFSAARRTSSFIFLLCLALALFLAFTTGVMIGLIVSMGSGKKGGGGAASAAKSLSEGLISKTTLSGPAICKTGDCLRSTFKGPVVESGLALSSMPTFHQDTGDIVAKPEDQAPWHNYKDEELFRRAAAVKPANSTQIPKIAFLFLTRGPLPLALLWERFFCGHEDYFSIYIHTAPKFRYDKSTIPPVFHNRQIRSQPVKWGDVSLVDAERRLIANALLDPANARFLLMSESCIPLFNFTTVYNFIITSKHSFTQVFDDKGPYGRGRWNQGFLPEVPKDLWRKGQQWFEVDRHVAVITIKDTKYYPKFRDYCKPYCYVDEHYMPTMYYLLARERMANRTLTWVDWSRGGYHPATYTRKKINQQLLLSVKRKRNCEHNGEKGHICFLFARKFDKATLFWLLWNSKRILEF